MPKTSAMKATLAAILLAVTFAPAAAAYRLEGGRWPTTTITYYNEVPAYSWAVDTAAYAWNTSGARVRFVKASRISDGGRTSVHHERRTSHKRGLIGSEEYDAVRDFPWRAHSLERCCRLVFSTQCCRVFC